MRLKLTILDQQNNYRSEIANLYYSLIDINKTNIELPQSISKAKNVWHHFVIKSKKRDYLRKYLKLNGIETEIHYPIPPNLTQAYSHLGYSKKDLLTTYKLSKQILSLPMYDLKVAEKVAKVINNFQ